MKKYQKTNHYHGKKEKIKAIDKIKTASIEGKLVECADKINNLETLYNLYKEQGEKNLGEL